MILALAACTEQSDVAAEPQPPVTASPVVTSGSPAKVFAISLLDPASGLPIDAGQDLLVHYPVGQPTGDLRFGFEVGGTELGQVGLFPTVERLDLTEEITSPNAEAYVQAMAAEQACSYYLLENKAFLAYTTRDQYELLDGARLRLTVFAFDLHTQAEAEATVEVRARVVYE